MEEIKENLSERNYYFLKRMEEYIGDDLIFFGSIKRCDFVKNYSDIDIAIISDNVAGTLIKLKSFLDIDDRKIRKVFQKMSNNKTIVYGYKTYYDDADNNLSLEMIIYDEKYRKQVMEHINIHNRLPFYITYFLLLIKIVYYKLNLISSSTYKWIKGVVIENLNRESHNNLIAIKI
jgi:predicted nucleotidyltransferase